MTPYQRRKALRKSLNLCWSCDRTPVENRMFCTYCAEVNKSKCAEYKKSPSVHEALKQADRERTVHRKECNLCTACGKEPPQTGYRKCSKCRQIDAVGSVTRISDRRKQGLCTTCGKRLVVKTESSDHGFARKYTKCDDCREYSKKTDSTLASRFSRTRSTRSRLFTWTLTFSEYVEIVSRPCDYCGLENDTIQSGGLDRLDNSRGYEYGNVVSCCPICNMVRNNIFTPDEMKILGQTVREIKIARLQRNKTKERVCP